MASPESQGVNNSETSYAEFNALILRHKAMIWHICSDYKLGSAWNIEDCVQEVIMNLWRSFKGFEGRSSEKTWVWRVATNTMLMLQRKDVRSPQTESIGTESIDKKDEEAGNDSYQQLQQLKQNGDEHGPQQRMVFCSSATHHVLKGCQNISLEKINPEEGESKENNSTRPADGAIVFLIQTGAHVSSF